MLVTLSIVLLLLRVAQTVFPKISAPSTLQHLMRRMNPSLNSSFGAFDLETQQINDAFLDAIELASYAITSDIDTNGPIFGKYFANADKAIVRDVFMNIIGRPSNPSNPNPYGSVTLGRITVTRSDPDGDCAADPRLMAQLTAYDTATPTLEVCPIAGLRHGSIGRGPPRRGPNVVECENLGNTVSWRMETLGSILLHEYT